MSSTIAPLTILVYTSLLPLWKQYMNIVKTQKIHISNNNNIKYCIPPMGDWIKAPSIFVMFTIYLRPKLKDVLNSITWNEGVKVSVIKVADQLALIQREDPRVAEWV